MCSVALLKGPTEWRIVIDDLKAVHARCKQDGIAIVVALVSDLPEERTQLPLSEFQSVLTRDIALKAHLVLPIASTPTAANVRLSHSVRAATYNAQKAFAADVLVCESTSHTCISAQIHPFHVVEPTMPLRSGEKSPNISIASLYACRKRRC